MLVEPIHSRRINDDRAALVQGRPREVEPKADEREPPVAPAEAPIDHAGDLVAVEQHVAQRVVGVKQIVPVSS